MLTEADASRLWGASGSRAYLASYRAAIEAKFDPAQAHRIAETTARVRSGRLTEHLPGQHKQKLHGRKGLTGDPNAALDAVAKARTLDAVYAALGIDPLVPALRRDLGSICEDNGLASGTPEVVTEEEYLRRRAAGEQVWYRGVRGDELETEEYFEEFTDSDQPFYGHGVFGDGIYIADGRGIWPVGNKGEYTRKTSPGPGGARSAKNAAEMYASDVGGSGGAIWKGTVQPGATIASYDRLLKARNRVQTLVARRQTEIDASFDGRGSLDPGSALRQHRISQPDWPGLTTLGSLVRQDSSLAAMMGFQAVLVEGRTVGAGVHGDQLVVFDRSALSVVGTQQRQP